MSPLDLDKVRSFLVQNSSRQLKADHHRVSMLSSHIVFAALVLAVSLLEQLLHKRGALLLWH